VVTSKPLDLHNQRSIYKFGGCRDPKVLWGEGLGGSGATEPKPQRRSLSVVPDTPQISRDPAAAAALPARSVTVVTDTYPDSVQKLFRRRE
jgi:hypothetical protein